MISHGLSVPGGRAAVLARARTARRIGALLMRAAPQMSLDGWLRARDYIPAGLKQPKLAAALQSLRTRGGPKPSISINRIKARVSEDGGDAADSIVYQIHKELGAHARGDEIFRGGEQWWRVSFVGEHVSDAGGGFRGPGHARTFKSP